MTEALKTVVTVSVNLNTNYIKLYAPYIRNNQDGSYTFINTSAEFDKFGVFVQELPETEGITFRYE